MNTGNAKPKNSKRSSKPKKNSKEKEISPADWLNAQGKVAADLSRDREIPHVELPPFGELAPLGIKDAMEIMTGYMMKYELSYVRVLEIEIRKDSFKPKEPIVTQPKPPTPAELEAEENEALFWSTK